MRYTAKNNVQQFETSEELIEFINENPVLAIKQMNAGIHHIRSSEKFHAKQRAERIEFKEWRAQQDA